MTMAIFDKFQQLAETRRTMEEVGGEFFNTFNADSLNIFVIYWFAPPAYWDYLAHGQQLNLRLAEEFEKAGIEFAFPTQTLHVVGDPKREMAIKMLGQDLETQPIPPSHGAP